jgi:uncharacterized protein YeaO (DUF488 family)
MFKLGSVYDAKNTVGDEREGLRVLIMRQWPRGIRKSAVDAWLKDAAPSRELLGALRRGEIGWQEFEVRYRDEIVTQRAGVLDTLRELEREHGTVTLLCYERIPPAEHCHRRVLLELLNGRSAD